MSVKIKTIETTGQGAVATVPKINGGFGADVSQGLTNGHTAFVSANAITIAADARMLPTPGAQGAVPYDTGTGYGETAVGIAGQILVSGGTSLPTWGTRGGSVLVFSLNTGQSFVASGYLGVSGDGSSTINVNVTPWVVPATGTLSRLRVFGFSNTSGTTHILIYKASSALSPVYAATALDATVTGGTFSGSDTSNTVAVTAGELIVAFSSASWSANGACVNVLYTPN